MRLAGHGYLPGDFHVGFVVLMLNCASYLTSHDCLRKLADDGEADSGNRGSRFSNHAAE